jgi:hypothetical protein
MHSAAAGIALSRPWPILLPHRSQAPKVRIDPLESIVDLTQQNLAPLGKTAFQARHAVLLRALFEFAFPIL